MLRDSARNPSDLFEAPLASSPPLNANYEVNLLSPSSSTAAAAGLNILISLRGFNGGCQYIKRFPIAGTDSPFYGGQNYYAPLCSAPSFFGGFSKFPSSLSSSSSSTSSVYRWRIKIGCVKFPLPSLKTAVLLLQY